MGQIRARVAGVHAVPYSDELLRRTLEEWGEGGDEASLIEAIEEWGPRIREIMEGLCLIEMIIDDAPLDFCLDEVSQDRELADDSQVPYDEHWLDAGGQSVISRDFHAPGARPLRVAFFLHGCRLGEPLYGKWGSLDLPPLTPLPPRLASIVRYCPPT